MFKHFSLCAFLWILIFSGCVKKVTQPVQREKDAYTLKDGARFKHAPTWTVREAEKYVTVLGPEPGFSVHIVAAPKVKDAKLESAERWRAIDPSFSYPVYLVQRLPKDGFESVDQIKFDVPAKDSRLVIAIALNSSMTTYWLLIEATNELISRRHAELSLIVGSFRAPGAKEEVLASKTAKVWGEHEKKVFQDFVATALHELKVPGAAVMIIDKDGSKYFARSFGVKDIETKKPVTLDTPFLIGSTTKALTTFMMASLVDKGIITWETKLKDVLPNFRVADEALTNALDMRHSVSASTGMPRRDYEFLFVYNNVTAEERMKELSFMAPTTKMGETFQYSNHLVMAGGYAAAKAYKNDLGLEQSYARAMTDLVYKPLGMKRTVIQFTDAAKLGNALPHGVDINGNMKRIPLSHENAVISVGPAGALWSTVEDLSRYVIVELNSGVLDGKQVISPEPLLERRKPGAKMGDSSHYGLGLYMQDYHSITFVGHNGNTLGFSALLIFLPDQGLGMVILNNGSDANAFLKVVADKFLELTFDGPKKADALLEASIKSIAESRTKLVEHVQTSKETTLWMKLWKGNYQNETLGTISIKQKKNGDFLLDCGEWQSEIASYRESDGTHAMFLTAPPYFLILQPQEETHSLFLDAGQQKYEFVPVNKYSSTMQMDY